MLIKPGIQLHALHRTFAVHNTFIKQIVTETVTTRDVNIEFFPNPDIECDNPVKIRISDFIRAA